LLLEANPDPMWVFDSETLRFLAVNDAAIEHDGHSRDEFLAMTILDIRSLEGVPAARALEDAVGTGLARRGGNGGIASRTARSSTWRSA